MPWLQTTIEIINGAADPLTSRCSQGTTSSIPAPPGGLHAFTGCLAVVHRECRPRLGFVHEAKAKGALPSPPAHAWVDESALVSLTYSRSCPHTALLLYLKITFKSPSLGFFNRFPKKKWDSGNSYMEQGWHPVAKMLHLRSGSLKDLPTASLLGDNKLRGDRPLMP